MKKMLKPLIYGLTGLSFLIFSSIIIYIFAKGLPNLSGGLFSTDSSISLLPSLLTTIYIVFLSLLISVPIGIISSIYIVEYTRRDNPLRHIMTIATSTLASIPSIVYGLFGMLFFVTFLKLNFSILSGSLTLSMMVLPLIMNTTEEALRNVPRSIREASLALGASKTRTIFKVVLPSALNGIISGIILSIGRIIGESAALIYTAGTVSQFPKSFMDSGRTLTVHMYALSTEGLHTNESYGTAVILVFTVIVINFLSESFLNLKLGGKSYE